MKYIPFGGGEETNMKAVQYLFRDTRKAEEHVPAALVF
jgi:hypothetical protein